MSAHVISIASLGPFARQSVFAGAVAAAISGIPQAVSAADFPYRSFPACQPAPGPSVPAIAIRAIASQLGYRLTAQPTAHTRQIRVRAAGAPPVICGFWRAEGARNNKRYALYFSLRGRPLYQRELAPPRLDEDQLRVRLRQQGYRRIRDIRLVRVGRRQAYTATARRRGASFQVFADPSTGQVFRAQPVNEFLSGDEARKAIVRAGFSDVENLLRGRHQNREVYTARGVKDGKRHAVMIDARNGRVLRTRVLGDAWLGEKDMRRALRSAGYRDIDNLRRRNRQGRQIYTARATRNGKRYLLIADARNGRILRTREIGGGLLSEQDMRRSLRQAGYRNIENLKRIRKNRDLLWQAEATRGGKRYSITARARDGRILRARELPAAALSRDHIIRALDRQGWVNITNVRRGRHNGAAVWLADASRKGRDHKLIVRARDGRVLQATAQPLNERQIRLALRQQGYRRIRDLERVRRGRGIFYRASARKGGQRFRLLARAADGRVVRARPDQAQLLNEQQIERRVAQAGYRDIRVLRQSGATGKPTYMVRAQRQRRIWLLIVSAKDGSIANRRMLRALRASPGQVSVALARDGYAHVENVRFVEQGGQAYYQAAGWKDGSRWRLRLDPAASRVLSRQRIGGRLSERAVERRLARAGYRDIDVLRWRPDDKAGAYLVVAWQNRSKYRLRVSAADGAVARRRKIDEQQVPVEVIRRLARLAGFHHMDDLAWQGRQGAYRGVAWQNGYRWRIWVRARDGRILRRERLGGRVSDVAVRRRLTAAGFTEVSGLRFVDNRREGYYVAVARRGDEKFRVFARAADGRPVRTVLLSRRLGKAAILQRIRAAGYERAEELDLERDKDGDYYTAFAWKNGRKYRLKVRASDGGIYWRTLLEPRASTVNIEDLLFSFRYDRHERIRFVEDAAGGHFEVIAWRAGRKYRLYLRAHDGSIYRRVTLAK